MAFSPAFIDELVARNPIEEVVGRYVNLKRSGANLFGLCPFHGEKTASFSVAPDKGIYYCFGCHKGGGVVNFTMEIEGLSYGDAVRKLADRVGMVVPDDPEYQSRYRQQERLWALNAEAARFFHSMLYAPEGKEALDYANRRGMPKSVLTTFGLGYAPNSWNSLINAMKAKGYTEEELRAADLVSEKGGRIYDRFRNRFMFPIIDVRDKVIGFGGRVLDDSKPKYLNTSETMVFNKRKNLFALNYAKRSKLGYIILVEGYMDAIALHQYGFDCAVASLGTALTDDGATLLSKYTDQVILIYDGDDAGQNATKRAIPILEKTGLQVKVLQMQDAKDPDEYLKKFGADRFKLLLEGSSDRIEYQLNSILRKYDLREDAQRVQYIQESAELIATLSSAVRREVYSTRIAEAGRISTEAMKLEVEKARERRARKEYKKQEQLDLTPAYQLQPKSRSIRYSNVKSAVAEEMVIAMLVREPALFEKTARLSQEAFSAPLLGKVYGQLKDRYFQGLEVTPGVLTELESEEMSHIVSVCQRHTGPVSEAALDDCIRTIASEHQAASVSSDDDLRQLQNRLRERKGVRQ